MNSALPKLLNSGSLEKLDDSHKSAFFELTNHDIKRLDGVLKSWKFKRIPVSGDGNCLFYAVAHTSRKTGFLISGQSKRACKTSETSDC